MAASLDGSNIAAQSLDVQHLEQKLEIIRAEIHTTTEELSNLCREVEDGKRQLLQSENRRRIYCVQEGTDIISTDCSKESLPTDLFFLDFEAQKLIKYVKPTAASGLKSSRT